MRLAKFNLLLADDDWDDCIFFKEALEELQVTAELTTISDGVQLMSLLNTPEFVLPDALYLDLNMPRKNGLDCLTEIKQNGKLKPIPVIVFSTSFDTDVVNLLQEHGANYYIQKPAEFSSLKKVIAKSLELISISATPHSPEDKFVITSS
jgi:CheY-like chemotaxis protein